LAHRNTVNDATDLKNIEMAQLSFLFPLVLGSFTAISYVCFVVVYNVQPTPFIDEAFHIPQAQKYCAGNFTEWDSKITTFPGLYLFSIGLNGPLSWLMGQPLCDVFYLRITNLVAAAFILSTLHKLLTYIHGDKVDSKKLMLVAVNLSLLPVLYWFTFLYYTDVLSTFVVLVMILLHLHSASNTAAAMGAVAVMMRQTNVIWVGFLTVLMAADSLSFRLLKSPIISYQDTKVLLKKLRKLAAKPYRLAEILADVVVDCFSYVAVLMAFIVFITYNGSIVVGDRSAHQAMINLPQVGYFCLFSLVFSLPYAPNNIQPFIDACKRNLVLTVAVAVLATMAVHSNTLVHPYLLADNRHYTFYVWSRFYGKFAFFKYLMVPVYMFGGYLNYVFLSERNFVFKAMFLLCLCACIVPQKLLELRYFIIPFLILRLQVVSHNWLQLWTETLYFLLINAITLYIFVSKTFYWEDTSEPQRIMW